MPTNSVKLVYGPLGLLKTRLNWLVVSDPLGQVFGNTGCRFSGWAALFVGCALLGLATVSSIEAQTLNARISVITTSPGRLRIDAEFPAATNTLSFCNTYAGVLGLGERIESLEGIGDNGERVQFRGQAPGEFQAAEAFSKFTYQVNLAAPLRPADQSHVSSLNSDHGLLMMADLLPQSTRNSSSFTSAVISVDVPRAWAVVSNVKNLGSQFSTDDPETAVFLVGPSLHEKRRRLATTDFSMVTAGEWPFSEDDATKIAGEILEEYSRVTRYELKRNAVLMLVPFPGDVGPGSWSAETRGNVVVLLLGRNGKRKSVLSRLGIVLSHELFHLWVPNSLKFEGAYDWFFEGFTLYQALRMDLRLGLISFGDYLETIAAVYDSYRASADRDHLSLIEASERRWTTSTSLVYEKGMLVAFLYDLNLKRITDCRASFDDMYAELFQRSAAGQTSANQTIISVLTDRAELKSFAKDYVESVAKIDLEAMVKEYGIQVQSSGPGTKLVVIRDLSKAQRKLLGCVGYRK
jgi:predicted metalloprotease with PDZ domain